MKTKLTVAGVVAVLFCLSSPIQAYVLQGRHVLDLMISRLGAAQSLFVNEKLIYYRMVAAADSQHVSTAEVSQTSVTTSAETSGAMPPANQDAVETEEIEVEGALRFVFSQAFRSDERSANSERIQISSGGGTLTIIDGRIAPSSRNRFDLFKDILLYRSREPLADRLWQMGVDVEVTSLGRFEDEIAIVVGAEYPDMSVNQLWVDKDTLLPIRLILKGGPSSGDSDTLEMRYLLWWKVGDTKYPSRIEFYQDDQLVRVRQARNFELNPTFSRQLFDIQHLRSAYPVAPAQPTAPADKEEPSEIQKTINDFKRIFQ